MSTGTIRIVNGGLLVKRSYTTEIDFTANLTAGGEVTFSDVQELRKVLVYGIEISPYEAQLASKNGLPAITQAQCAGLVMSFFNNSLEQIKWQPATGYIAALNGGSYRLYDGLKMNLTRSKTVCVSALPIAGNALIVSFYYLDINKDLPKRVVRKK